MSTKNLVKVRVQASCSLYFTPKDKEVFSLSFLSRERILFYFFRFFFYHWSLSPKDGLYINLEQALIG